MLPDRARTLLGKIIHEIEPGEKAPFRALQRPHIGPYLPGKDAVWALFAGSAVLCRCGWRGVRWVMRAATSKDEKPGSEGKDKAAPAKKESALADIAERWATGALCVVVTGAFVGGIAATIGSSIAPYLPTAAGIAAPVWIVSALIMAPERPRKETEAQPEQPSPALSVEDATERDRVALLVALEAASRGRNGVHLGELHERLAGHPLFGGVHRAHMGALAEGLGVPVQRTLSVDGIEGRSGVRRTDVEALLLALPREGQEDPSRPSESGSDQQESRSLSDPSRAALGLLSGGT